MLVGRGPETERRFGKLDAALALSNIPACLLTWGWKRTWLGWSTDACHHKVRINRFAHIHRSCFNKFHHR